MKSLAILLIIVSFVICSEEEKISRVIDFTHTDFKEEIKKYEGVLVEFYTPWWDLWKHINKELEGAAEKLASMNYTAQIGKIDAANQTKIGDEFEIKSHPSFIWFQNQKPNVYSGGLLAEDIYTWIKRKMDPPSELVDEQRLEAFQKEEKILVVFYGDPESKEFEQYKRATFADIKGKYVHVTDKKMKLPQGLKMPGIAVFRNFDDPVRVFIGPITTEAIEEFVKELSVPRCVELILEYFEEIFEPGKPSLFLFYDEKNPDQNKTKELFCKSAEKKKAKVKYVFSGITEGVQMNLAEYIGINKKVLPKLAILENVQDKGMDK